MAQALTLARSTFAGPDPVELARAVIVIACAAALIAAGPALPLL